MFGIFRDYKLEKRLSSAEEKLPRLKDQSEFLE